MRQLIIASKNPGKIREIKEILADIPFEIKSLLDIGYIKEINETGKSFEENAIIKATTIGDQNQILTLAEDSGLEVDALGGKPGIYSARFEQGSDLDRINKLLKDLKGISKVKRTARYKTVVAIYNPETKSIETFEGTSAGYITEKPIGTNGFGYDPVFFNIDLGKINAIASFEEKNRVSHRAKALLKVKKFLTGEN